MDEIIKNQSDLLKKQSDKLDEKDKTISAKDAEIAELKKKLEKPASTLNVSDAATADKETKTVKLTPPARTVFDTVYARPRLIDVEVPASDKKAIKDLTDKGYRIAS